MQSTKQRQHKPIAALVVMALGWALLGSAAQAQTSNPRTGPLTLQALFEQAWQRQPDAQSAALRREAAQATRSAATAWTAEPVALELSTKTDRPGSNQGSREAEVGLALPLWLPGERARKAALADAELQALDSRQRAAQLQLAATVREAWWAAQRAQADWALAQDRLLNAQRLAADVARRVRAGDLSRADQAQADGAVAQAEAALAEAQGSRDAALAALADAEAQALDSRQRAAQLQLAATVREAWWAAQRAQADWALAQDRLNNAQRLAADVARRVRAGDLSRADQAQADSAVSQAEAALAEAQGSRDAALAALAAWGVQAVPDGALADAAEPEPAVPDATTAAAQHPAATDWQDQAEVARRAADLAAVQTRANPELTVAATRAREQAGDRYQQTFTVGLRVPLGGGDRAQAKQAAARAEALAAEVRAAAERDRLAADIAAAVARVKATQAQRDALARNAALAQGTRGFIDKAFRLGEADGPTRLRVELEAAQAERQLARARIDAAAAISTLRQALGLLPQ